MRGLSPAVNMLNESLSEKERKTAHGFLSIRFCVIRNAFEHEKQYHSQSDRINIPLDRSINKKFEMFSFTGLKMLQ